MKKQKSIASEKEELDLLQFLMMNLFLKVAVMFPNQNTRIWSKFFTYTVS